MMPIKVFTQIKNDAPAVQRSAYKDKQQHIRRDRNKETFAANNEYPAHQQVNND